MTNQRLDSPIEQGGSFWETGIVRDPYPRLYGEHHFEVVIIGAGITGLTAGLQLANAGVSVAIVEAGRIGSGTSGSATAHLTTAYDHDYQTIIKSYDVSTAQLLRTSMHEGIDLIETFVNKFQIDAHFRRLSGFYFTEGNKDQKFLEKEWQAAGQAGADVELDITAPLPFPTSLAVEYKNQAEIHALRYLLGLASAFTRISGNLFENSPVIDFKAGKTCKVTTTSGNITADQIIMATHTPLGRSALHAALAPQHSYVIAFEPTTPLRPNGLFWDTNEPYRYIRAQDTPQGPMILLGGEDQHVGEANHMHSFRALEDYARERFSVKMVTHRWLAQFYDSADHLPFIGPSPLAHNLYYATGFSGDGMTIGTIAGHMTAMQVLGRDTIFDDLFRPARIKTAGLKNYLSLNAHVAKTFITDRLKTKNPNTSPTLAELPIGSGCVIDHEGKKFAAYRDELGNLHSFSAVCSHLGCIVRWNGAAHSFDCPCHGSRFDVYGQVMDGPALTALKAYEIEVPKEEERSA